MLIIWEVLLNGIPITYYEILEMEKFAVLSSTLSFDAIMTVTRYACYTETALFLEIKKRILPIPFEYFHSFVHDIHT